MMFPFLTKPHEDQPWPKCCWCSNRHLHHLNSWRDDKNTPKTFGGTVIHVDQTIIQIGPPWQNDPILVWSFLGGKNIFSTCWWFSNWIISPGRGEECENTTYLSLMFFFSFLTWAYRHIRHHHFEKSIYLLRRASVWPSPKIFTSK